MGQSNIGSGPLAGQQIYKTDELAYGLGNSYTTCSIGGQRFIPQSLPLQAGGDFKEFKDNTGQTCSIVVPESFQTSSISGMLIKTQATSASSMVRKGDKVENLPTVQGMVSGVTWRVQDFSLNGENENVAMISLSVKSYTF